MLQNFFYARTDKDEIVKLGKMQHIQCKIRTVKFFQQWKYKVTFWIK